MVEQHQLAAQLEITCVDKQTGRKRPAGNGPKAKSPLPALAQPLPGTKRRGCRDPFLLCYRRKANTKFLPPPMSCFTNASISIVESRKDNQHQSLKGKTEQKLGQTEASRELDQHPTQPGAAQQQQQRWDFSLHLTAAWDVYHDLLLLPGKGRRAPAATSFHTAWQHV